MKITKIDLASYKPKDRYLQSVCRGLIVDWELSIPESKQLFMVPKTGTLKLTKFTDQQIDYIIMLTHIHQYLNGMFDEKLYHRMWLDEPCIDPPFCGSTPLSLLIRKNLITAREVADYIYKHIPEDSIYKQIMGEPYEKTN